MESRFTWSPSSTVGYNSKSHEVKWSHANSLMARLWTTNHCRHMYGVVNEFTALWKCSIESCSNEVFFDVIFKVCVEISKTAGHSMWREVPL